MPLDLATLRARLGQPAGNGLFMARHVVELRAARPEGGVAIAIGEGASEAEAVERAITVMQRQIGSGPSDQASDAPSNRTITANSRPDDNAQNAE